MKPWILCCALFLCGLGVGLLIAAWISIFNRTTGPYGVTVAIGIGLILAAFVMTKVGEVWS